MTFRVGQKVVCIVHCPADKRRDGALYAEEGQIYTIRGFCPASDGRTLLYLDEIHNKPMWCKAFGEIEWGFNAKYFRPVVERKTDITVFTEILRKASKPARGPVVALQDRP